MVLFPIDKNNIESIIMSVTQNGGYYTRKIMFLRDTVVSIAINHFSVVKKRQMRKKNLINESGTESMKNEERKHTENIRKVARWG